MVNLNLATFTLLRTRVIVMIFCLLYQIKLFFKKIITCFKDRKKYTILFLNERFLSLDQKMFDKMPCILVCTTQTIYIFCLNLYICFLKGNTVLQMSYLINQNKMRSTCTDIFLFLDSK